MATKDEMVRAMEGGYAAPDDFDPGPCELCGAEMGPRSFVFDGNLWACDDDAACAARRACYACGAPGIKDPVFGWWCDYHQGRRAGRAS